MAIVKKGDRISLAYSSFFFLNNIGVNLRRGKEETTIVPENTSDHTMKQIEQSILVGDIKLGYPKEKKQIIPNNENLVDVLESGRNKVNEFLKQLFEDTTVKNQDKMVKLEKLLELEKKDKNRRSVTLVLERYLSGMAGVTPVVEEKEQEKVEISFVKGNKEDKTE